MKRIDNKNKDGIKTKENEIIRHNAMFLHTIHVIGKEGSQIEHLSISQQIPACTDRMSDVQNLNLVHVFSIRNRRIF